MTFFFSVSQSRNTYNDSATGGAQVPSWPCSCGVLPQFDTSRCRADPVCVVFYHNLTPPAAELTLFVWCFTTTWHPPLPSWPCLCGVLPQFDTSRCRADPVCVVFNHNLTPPAAELTLFVWFFTTIWHLPLGSETLALTEFSMWPSHCTSWLCSGFKFPNDLSVTVTLSVRSGKYKRNCLTLLQENPAFEDRPFNPQVVDVF